MPKSTFYRISEEKRNRILTAARNEFLSVPYSEVSINKIIKEAKIPRGSFYQYFEDKEDLFYFMLQEHKNYLSEFLMREMEKVNGDIFRCIENNIDRVVDTVYCDNSGKIQMLFSEPRILETVWMAIMKNEVCKENDSCRLIDKIDRSFLDVEDEAELILLVSILGVVIRESIGKLFLHSEKVNPEKAKEMIHAKVGTLKRHYSKKE